MPKVSVIIPNYNHARYLYQRIESVLNQTYQDFELIILDDCSTDNSKEIIEYYRNHPKVSQIVYNKENSGSPFKQWHKGINLAKGEYIWIAESDDYADVMFLETMVTHLEQNSNVGIAFCSSHWVDAGNHVKEDLSIYDTSFIKNGLEEIKYELVYRNTIQNASSVLIRKSRINTKNQAYTRMKSCGDWLFYVLVLTNSDLLFDHSRLNYFRWYHTNTSNLTNQQGLWTIEGSKVLWLALKSVNFDKSEKNKILNHWLTKILLLQNSNLKYFYFKITNLFKLFILFPKGFCKFFYRKWRMK